MSAAKQQAPALNITDLIQRLEDQRISGFNAAMAVREEAAIELRRLSLEVADHENRWKELKWCHAGCKDTPPKDSGSGGPGIGGCGGLF